MHRLPAYPGGISSLGIYQNEPVLPGYDIVGIPRFELRNHPANSDTATRDIRDVLCLGETSRALPVSAMVWPATRVTQRGWSVCSEGLRVRKPEARDCVRKRCEAVGISGMLNLVSLIHF